MGDAQQENNRLQAQEARLRYVTDSQPGYYRQGSHPRFYYTDPEGRRVTDAKVLDRIAALVLPPAWQDVWICRYPNGHLQATGIDAKGRKQYRYHPQWSHLRSQTKFSRLPALMDALPALYRRMESDLATRGTNRQKVVAALVQLMLHNPIRVGNREYVEQNESYGLTTLRDKHVKVKGATITFAFRGKKGKEHLISIHDKRLARIVQKCKDIPGQELFQYIDGDGQRRTVESGDVNDYIREACQADFTSKDLRTLAGTFAAFDALLPWCDVPDCSPKKVLAEVVKQVAEQLGNTPSVCKKYYILPALLQSFEEGSLHKWAGKPTRRTPEHKMKALRKLLEHLS